jgi:hypothetical protein
LDEVPNTSILEEHAARLMGHDPAEVDKIKALYDTSPENEIIKSLYRTALTKHYSYLCVIEQQMWRKIGWTNPDKTAEGFVIYGDDYIESVKKALENARAHIRPALEQHASLSRIGMGEMPRLLMSGKAAEIIAPTDKPVSVSLTPRHASTINDPAFLQQSIAKMEAAALKNYETRMKFVSDIAQKKQDALIELVTLNPIRNLNEYDSTNPTCKIFLTDAFENVLFILDLDLTTGNSSIDTEQGGIALSDLPTTGFNTNVIQIIKNDEINELLPQVMWFANKMLNDYQQAAQPDHNVDKYHELEPSKP